MGIPNVSGRAYEPVDFTIEAGHAAAFARAIGADESAGVPPTYGAVYALGTTAPQLFDDPNAEVDLSRLVHAEQEFTWDRHPRAGERVQAQGRVTSDIARRGARFITFETAVVDADGAPLARSRALFVVRA